MRKMTKKSGYVGAQMGRGRNMDHKNLGSGKQKKGFIAISVMLLGILVLLVSVTMAPAVASDWPQFQSDKTNTGIANEKILGRSVAWSVYAHSDPWNMAGIDAVPIVADGNVYVLDAPGYICSFDATTGAENEQKYYNIPTGPPYFQLSTPAYGDGKIFFGLSSGGKKGHVFAVNADDVTDKVWERTINESEQVNTPITYENSMIYFGTWNGTVDRTYSGTYYCLDATNGDEVCNYTTGADNGYYWAGACIIDDYIIFGSDLGIVTCLYKSNCTLVDEENLADVESNAGQIRSSVTCNAAGSRVYFSEAYIDGGNIGGRVWAYDFNSATGNLSYAWHCSLNTASKSTPVVYNGRIYAGDGSFQANGRLYCIYESNGTIEWYYETPDNNGAGNVLVLRTYGIYDER
jgi:outer membrane protein assembly factor BamB